MSELTWLFERCLDYPCEVTIETTGVCNAHCVFCPHDKLDRKNDRMPEELFRKILLQLKEIPQSHEFYISPFKVNEFLKDPQIFKRLKLINDWLPNAYLRLFSNFNAATKNDIIQICKIKNLSDIDISLNSLDPEEYRKLMGLDLDRTVRNIFMLLKHIRQNGLEMRSRKIIFSRVSINPKADARYLESFNTTFEDYLDLVAPIVIARGEWIDHMPNKTPRRQDVQCPRWAEINICCNGMVAFCCMDAKAEYFIGNVNDNTVLEIYNQPDYRCLRTEALYKRNITPCCRCSL